jgi:hypothetical protein
MSPTSTRPATAGPHAKDGIEADPDRGSGTDVRPQPRRRAAAFMLGAKFWMALGWLLVILLLVFPFPWVW